ncbi:hypothetical protein [Sphingomonas sp. 28-63-12]|uniref:hypothetical protein n=1 Tax=Sphingomonas sp. 28-63-12 TaxID=1970434 RepID=UPI000BCAF421|nr:MAG: hypothetical protein B7Y47_03060 [Sphingomonas sp. 28-63-12]
MIFFTSLASIAILAAAPALAADRTPAATAAPRCAPHHLPIPDGKGLVTTVMRCSDRGTATEAAAVPQRPAAKADAKAVPAG